jgi:hypothetical protein
MDIDLFNVMKLSSYLTELRYPFVPEIMHGRAPEVFLHQ